MGKINKQDTAQFDNYFRRYYPALCHFALNYLKGYERAEDVVQNVFIKLLDCEEEFENDEHLRAYLYKVVRNSCLNEIKSFGIHADILESIQKDKSAEDHDFFVRIVRSEVYREIMAAVETLPPECKKVFRMAYIDGLDNPEISEHLGISINTVKVQKNKAKHLLREKLDGLYPLVFIFLYKKNTL